MDNLQFEQVCFLALHVVVYRHTQKQQHQLKALLLSLCVWHCYELCGQTTVCILATDMPHATLQTVGDIAKLGPDKQISTARTLSLTVRSLCCEIRCRDV